MRQHRAMTAMARYQWRGNARDQPPRLRGIYRLQNHLQRVLDRRRKRPKWLKRLVGAARFELATPCAQGRCATRLRYAPTFQQLTASFLCLFGPRQVDTTIQVYHPQITISYPFLQGRGGLTRLQRCSEGGELSGGLMRNIRKLAMVGRTKKNATNLRACYWTGSLARQ